MLKDTYERLQLTVTAFDREDAITTSDPNPTPEPVLKQITYEGRSFWD